VKGLGQVWLTEGLACELLPKVMLGAARPWPLAGKNFASKGFAAAKVKKISFLSLENGTKID
jgi:hypothetical protein